MTTPSARRVTLHRDPKKIENTGFERGREQLVSYCYTIWGEALLPAGSGFQGEFNRESIVSNEDQSKIVKNERTALQVAALDAVLSGTTWHPVDSPEDFPLHCGAFTSGQLIQLLNDGALFAINIGGRRLVPDYAFDSLGNTFHVISELVQLFADSSPLRLASWMESRNSLLDGRRPREALETQPQLVVRAARAHLQGPMHG